MLIDQDTPDIMNYRIKNKEGELILGLKTFNTETCEGEMLVLEGAKHLGVVQDDGSVIHKVVGGAMTSKLVKIEGAYATYKGVKI